jgi:hypothetical protein
MGSAFSACVRPQSEPLVKSERVEVQMGHVMEPRVSNKASDERPVLKAMIGPIGGRGPLNSTQEEGRSRFGM